jgi:MFS transporter, DHA1 family, multidrug resistance protein
VPRPRLLPGLDPSLRRLLLALCTMEFLVWAGGGAIVPLLPTYLRAHGSSPALVGLVMAAYFAAGMLTQFPVGRLVDRVGPRPVVLAGLLLFVGGCVGFALVTGAAGGIVFRALQGTGAGSVTVAAAATVGYVVPVAHRGSTFATLYGSQFLAFAIGPLVGSAIGAASMRWLFFAAALAAVGAMVPAAAFLPGASQAAPRRHRLSQRELASRPVLGAVVVFVATGVLGGMYESCWSLLLHLRGATSIEIGLSWTLYCLPFALMSFGAGRLVDRADRRRLAAGGILASAAFAVIYPNLHDVVALVTLGTLESVGAVLVSPAALSVLSASVGVAEQGAAQGFVGTANTGAIALAAASCGALFGVSPEAPFLLSGVLLAVLATSVFVLWRHVPARSVGVRTGLALGADGPELGPPT